MQSHCRIGGNAIERAINSTLAHHPLLPDQAKPESLRFLEVAKEIALYHHERWEGGGYPCGLRGATIPLAARLMALADVFDALTTPRLYKEAWAMADAIAHIREQRGKQFDPLIVDAFEAELDAFASIQQQLADQPIEA